MVPSQPGAGTGQAGGVACVPAGESASETDEASFRLLNEFQRGFPLASRPFAVLGEAVGLDEDGVLAHFRRWQADGLVSRIGAVFAPRRVGASALAALSAPAGRLDAVAAQVSAFAEVNHNYEREHDYNLWFVLTAASAARLDEVVAQIECETGCPVIVLPLEEEFHIDLGFCLAGGGRESPAAPTIPPAMTEAGCALPAIERTLMAALQGGIALEARPFHALGRECGLSEAMVIELIEGWLREGLVKRFGVVVRHHELGFRANAMCVWNVPDELAHDVGCRLAAQSAVTLCYRRRRVLPGWPYNLYCMIHGKTREEVLAARAAIVARLGLDRFAHAVLFSTRRFKQRGARYWATASDGQGAESCRTGAAQ
jgi:DNA-binding Lrp family transcriptional regulator